MDVSIVWFKQDLRISDNPAVFEAAQLGGVYPIYILDDAKPEKFRMGAASKIWLNDSLLGLNDSMNGCLNIYIGSPSEVIKNLIDTYQVKQVFCNRSYEPWYLEQEKDVQAVCIDKKIVFKAFNGNYLYSPEEVLKEDRSFYKVFTAYKNKCRTKKSRLLCLDVKKIDFIKDRKNKKSIEDLHLIPKKEWYKKIRKNWIPGEISAKEKLDFFIKNHLNGYKEGRDFPSKENISKLSPHLHFGEISPVQILDAINKNGLFYAKENDVEHFLSEIIWREFSSYLLYYFPDLPIKNFNKKFNNFDWGFQSDFFEKWKTGNTGYPLIDAGMRELWQTGYMHNRVRMVVASFLVKNLNIHWKYGMDWFWDCLIDADLSNNSASWQWVAGSGVDAAPYFRIFNPISQGEKFDSDGIYTKKWVPELKNMPNKYLYKPWEAPKTVLEGAGVFLGKTYPYPIVDCSETRKDALARYHSL